MQVPVCRHIRPNGLQCQAVALKDQVFCYFHQRLHRTHRVYRNTMVARPDLERRGAIFDLGPLEDSIAIQIAISKTVNAIATNTIDLQHGRTLLYGLNLAAINARKLNPIPEPKAVVRELHTPPGLEQERLPDIAPPATTEIPDEIADEIPAEIPDRPEPIELTPTPTMLERILEQERTAATQQPQPETITLCAAARRSARRHRRLKTKHALSGSPHNVASENHCAEVARAMPNATIVPLHFEGWADFTESRHVIEQTFRDADLEARLRWINPPARSIPAAPELR